MIARTWNILRRCHLSCSVVLSACLRTVSIFDLISLLGTNPDLSKQPISSCCSSFLLFIFSSKFFRLCNPNIALVSMLRLEGGNEFISAFSGHVALLLKNGEQGLLNIAGHVLRISTHIDVCALLQRKNNILFA